MYYLEGKWLRDQDLQEGEAVYDPPCRVLETCRLQGLVDPLGHRQIRHVLEAITLHPEIRLVDQPELLQIQELQTLQVDLLTRNLRDQELVIADDRQMEIQEAVHRLLIGTQRQHDLHTLGAPQDQVVITLE